MISAINICGLLLSRLERGRASLRGAEEPSLPPRNPKTPRIQNGQEKEIGAKSPNEEKEEELLEEEKTGLPSSTDGGRAGEEKKEASEEDESEIKRKAGATPCQELEQCRSPG